MRAIWDKVLHTVHKREWGKPERMHVAMSAAKLREREYIQPATPTPALVDALADLVPQYVSRGQRESARQAVRRLLEKEHNKPTKIDRELAKRISQLIDRTEIDGKYYRLAIDHGLCQLWEITPPPKSP